MIELLSAFSTIMMHMSRFCEEIIMWNSNEYRFVEIDDAYSTGSSIMPQKKNPDIAELVRGKTGRVYGALTSILTTMKESLLHTTKICRKTKNLHLMPLTLVKGCLALFTGMISTMQFNNRIWKQVQRMLYKCYRCSRLSGKSWSTFPRCTRHCRPSGLTCIDKGISLDELPLEEYKAISPVFENDILRSNQYETCVEKRMTIGAPGPDVMRK